MQNFKRFICLVLISFTLASCERSSFTPETANNIDREEFMKKLSFKEQKSAFGSLSDNQKIGLWKSKIEHILTTDINNDQREALWVINKLLSNCVSFEELKYHTELKDSMLKLAYHTSYIDFTNMFITLESFPKYNLAKVSSIDSKILVDQVNESFTKINKYQPAVESAIATEADKLKCNCSWTCDSDSPVYTTKCTATGSGCGFLFLFSCETYS
jgi:hypothetical protein